jgi:hypothetical protein
MMDQIQLFSQANIKKQATNGGEYSKGSVH